MLAAALVLLAPLPPAPPACAAPPTKAETMISLPGRPFEPVVSADGCWVFVTLTSTSEVAAYQRQGDKLQLRDKVNVGGPPTGAVLTHDGTLLAVTIGQRGEVVFLNVAGLESGDREAILGAIGNGHFPGAVYANVSPDDHYLFVSDENAGRISVIDLQRARQHGFDDAAIVGDIATGGAPIALEFSPDGQTLYTTAEIAPPRLSFPHNCRPEMARPGAPAAVSEGAIFVVSVARAIAGKQDAVLASTPGGCSPVRLVLSPDGATAYVTARGENAVYAFDTARLGAGTGNPILSRVEVGTSPVGIAIVDGGRKLVVTNSDRFGGNARSNQHLTVLDADWHTWGTKAAILGQVSAGAFPRELRLGPGGATLYLTNFLSSQLEMIAVGRLP